MRFSEYFGLYRSQAYLDFVDVPLDTDLSVFVEPVAIKQLQSSWGNELASLLQTFFDKVLSCIRSGNNDEARRLLASLNESNEFHLGYSSGKSMGHGFGEGSAESVWTALTQSKASVTGLLRDLEDTALLIPGVGSDMISDAVCNILRGAFIKYTQDMCSYYGVTLTPNVASGPIWNPQKGGWEQAYVALPVTEFGKVILVPKIVVRHRLVYDSAQYYRHYILPHMQDEHIRMRSPLVDVLKDGRLNVTKKKLMEKYGKDKLAVAQQTVARPHVLDEYREQKANSPSSPLSQEQLAEVEGRDVPDIKPLIASLKSLPPGNQHAHEYEGLIEKIFTAIFYPSLCNPRKQHKTHGGRKIVDITYSNEAKAGFFSWLSRHYTCPMIFVECKNYGKEIGNPEIDQISGRFSPSRGWVGILVCRSLKDKKRMVQRCIDTVNDQRGYVIVLDDGDVEEIVEEYASNEGSQDHTGLRKKWEEIVFS
ncbi:hypothetical protein [Halomonas getboli]|uniref:hypothetical protein n=1 Tax=Halomonas getboli TaxID=2935862 RepID=UPI001FFEF122|nr:hypothetical protein [Halomonas getboli]MCK2183856.1 hypothetical protein [Halomonas getboli]